MNKDRRAVLDKVYHDRLYAAHEGDFLTFQFTNFVPIVRNYEDIHEYLAPCKRILDLGCGGGYDLLYMARQHPDKEFWGFDHSKSGIERARSQADKLGLSNVQFSVSSILDLDPDLSADLVILKDAFHHVVDPVQLVADLEKRTKRVILVEPSGLSYPMDYDDLLYGLKELAGSVENWLPVSVSESREGKRAPDTSGKEALANSAENGGEALENRYRPEEFEQFFSDWNLAVTGTLSIFSIWEPWFLSEDPEMEFVNRLALFTYRELDRRIRAAGVDLAAKHWIVYASRERDCGRVFDGFARLSSGQHTLANWRRRRLEKEWPGQKVVFDCIASLTEADQRAGGAHFIESGQLNLGGIRRDFLFEHPDSSVKYTLELPSGAEFRGFLGVNPAAWQYPGGQGITFELTVVSATGAETLLQETIDPRNRPEDRQWHFRQTDLSRFGGREVSLTLSTSAPAGALDYCWAGWGDPVILTPKSGT